MNSEAHKNTQNSKIERNGKSCKNSYGDEEKKRNFIGPSGIKKEKNKNKKKQNQPK